MEAVQEICSPKETERLKVLRRYEILDTPPDGSFDGFTKLAAQLLDMPIAIVSLVDEDRIWFKSRYGLEVQEVNREPGLCSCAILSHETYVIEDTQDDVHTMANSMVLGDLGIRFYAAAQLKTKEGYTLGNFCVMDKKPRKLSRAKRDILENLAELVVHQMELRLDAKIALKHQYQLLNITAHDLKNPLSVMPLLADMIIKNKDNPKAIQKIAGQIRDAGKRMNKIVHDFLESAREDTGRLKLRLKTTNLIPLVKGVIASNKALAKNKKQSLKLSIQSPCYVYADHKRLIEVVDNLVNNAIKYSPQGKKIRVSIKVKEQNAVIEVRDEGPGLTKDDMKHLFRRFTSLSASPTGGESSTGLGLSIVKKLVDAHRGKIYATSDGPGKGSVFVVELPLSEIEEPTPQV